MVEIGIIIGKDNNTLSWHSSCENQSIFDDLNLVLEMQLNKDEILGFAYFRHGYGYPSPSEIDFKNFLAIELVLGRNFKWWITNATDMTLVEWDPIPVLKETNSLNYKIDFLHPDEEPDWVSNLRRAATLGDLQ